MPRLPSVESLGTRPAPSAGGGVVGYRVPATGMMWEAVARAGAQLSQIGEQIENARTQARRSAQLNDAMGEATLALGELELKYQRDQEFTTSPKRFADEAELVRQRLETKVDDEGVRAAFNQKYNDLAIAKRLNVLTSATRQEGDYHVSRLDSTLDIYADAAAGAQNPTEVALVEGQAELAITDLQRAGWIRDVDAGQRLRGFKTKVDRAIVKRDIVADPYGTATRLMADPKYVPNLDPVVREETIDRALRRAETERNQQEVRARKDREQAAEGVDKEAIDAFAAGRLQDVRNLLPQMRVLMSPSRYEHWSRAVNGGMEASEDNPRVYGAISRMIYATDGRAPDYNAVSSAIFAAHSRGEIKSTTLTFMLNKAREISRAGGPNTPYEIEEAYIARLLQPAQFDVGAMFESKQANMGRGIREFQTWALSQSKPPTDIALRDKADEIVRKYRTGGSTNSPNQLADQVRELKAITDRIAAGKAQEGDEARRRILNELIESAEKGSGKR